MERVGAGVVARSRQGAAMKRWTKVPSGPFALDSPRVSLLDPKLDVVFKILLTREDTLLRAMLEAVLQPPSPIRHRLGTDASRKRVFCLVPHRMLG